MSCEVQLDCSKEVQTIRVVDVFLLGPAMAYVGVKHGGALGWFVAVSGMATIAFNGMRLVRAHRRKIEDGKTQEEQAALVQP